MPGKCELGTKADTLRSQYSQWKSRSRRHLALMGQVLSDSVWRYKWRISAIAAASLFGVLCQLGAVVKAVYFAGLLNRGTVVHVMGYQLDPRHSVTLVVAAGIGLGLALLVSAALLYMGRMAACRLSLKYEELCIRRVFRRTAQGGAYEQPGRPLAQDRLLKLVTMDARLCGRFFLKLLDLPTPVIYLVVTTIILLTIDALTFLVLSLLVLAFVPLLYRNNAQAARSFREYEEHGPGASLEKRGLLRRVTHLGGDPARTDGWLDRMFSSGEPRKSLDSYQGFLRSMETGSLLHGLLLSAMIAALVMFMGVRIVMRGEGWGQLLIFLVALRFATSSLRQLIGISNALSRFSPQVKRYFEFMDGSGGKAGAGARVHAEQAVSPPPLPEHVSRLAVFTSLPFSVYTARWTLQCLGWRDEDDLPGEDVFVVGNGYGCPEGVSLGDCLGPGLNADRIRAVFGQAGLLLEWQETFPDGLQQIINNNQWAKVRQGLKTALGLLAAEASGAGWVFVESAGLRALGRDRGRDVLKLLKIERLALVHSIVQADVEAPDAEWIVYVNGKGILAWGDRAWYQENRQELASRFRDSSGGRGTANDYSDPEREYGDLETL